MDRDALASRYIDADMFILPSRFEGVPLAILEAMSFGALVVSTNVGAVGEVITDGENGFLINPWQSEQDIVSQFVKAIVSVASDGRAYDAMRMAAAEAGMKVLWRDAAEMLASCLGLAPQASADRSEKRAQSKRIRYGPKDNGQVLDLEARLSQNS
jgi:glycosyltransferase involved in cell wall biosynthesis